MGNRRKNKRILFIGIFLILLIVSVYFVVSRHCIRLTEQDKESIEAGLLFKEDFEKEDIGDWEISEEEGIAECVRLSNTYALHLKADGPLCDAEAASPYFEIDNSSYIYEFDYYKPFGTSAEGWNIFSARDKFSNFKDIRVLQQADEIEIIYGNQQSDFLQYLLPSDRWVHFAIYKTMEGELELYIDGVFMGFYESLNTDLEEPVSIGFLGASGEFFGEGYWDNFRITTPKDTITINTTKVYENNKARVIEVKSQDIYLEFDGVFDSTPGSYKMPGFTEKSVIKGMDLTDTHPYNTLGLRWIGTAHLNPDENEIQLQCHQSYDIEVNSINSKIAAFTTITNTDSFNPLAGRTTYYIFKDLPQVILIDTEAKRVLPKVSTSYAYCLQAYSKGPDLGTEKYNGIRLWYEDPNPPGVPWFSGTGKSGNFNADPDGEQGQFLKWDFGKDDIFAVYWRPIRSTKGLIVLQGDGKNDWDINPPIGFIYDKTKTFGHYGNTNNNYFGAVPCINIETLRELDDKDTSQVLFFVGRKDGNISSIEDIYNLEESFRFPMKEAQLELTLKGRPSVILEETDSIDRTWQIVVLPAEYSRIDTNITNIYRGMYTEEKTTHTVMLLKDIKANSSLKIGELPITLKKNNDYEYTIDSRCEDIIKNVVVITELNKTTEIDSINYNEQVVMDYSIEDNNLIFTCDIVPGESNLVITSKD